MIKIDLPRVLLYGFLCVIAYFDQVPWWLAPALMLHDSTFVMEFRSKKYKQQEAEVAAFFARIREQSNQAGTPPPNKSTDWN